MSNGMQTATGEAAVSKCSRAAVPWTMVGVLACREQATTVMRGADVQLFAI